jgi:polysaccharide deacetylase 2 family uncharacterized protein YibQ
MAGWEGIPRRSSFRSIAALTLIPVAGLFVFLIWNFISLSRPATPEAPVKHPGPKRVPAAPSVQRWGSIVLIIDDVGFEGQPLERAMRLDPNINFAVLPNGTRTSDYVERLNQKGFEILCHLPMEPNGGATSPGPNAVLTSMSDDEITAATQSSLRAVRFARGMNNHMGSRATSDRRVMKNVLRALPEGMYFIDSRTGDRSIAESLAREMNIRTASRHIFLDNVQTDAAIREQIELAGKVARSQGVAVAIGHLNSVTVNALARELPSLRERGIQLVRARDVVN